MPAMLASSWGWGWTLAFLVAASVGTWLARRYALAHEMIDRPDDARRSHEVPTPRGGGVAIAVPVVLGSCWLAWWWPQHASSMLLFASGAACVAVVGLLDDHRPLSPWTRLAAYAFASLLLALAVHLAFSDPWLDVFAFAAALVLVNVWNFMDGIDGIAASQAAIASIAYAVLAPAPWNWIAVGLVAASCGFLPFNVPRARIFLGDVGSCVLGYVLAALAVATGHALGAHWSLALLPISAFVIDAALTLSARIVRGERWWTPHAQHAYQRWVRKTGRHMAVTMAYGVWTAVAVTAMMLLVYVPSRYGWWSLAVATGLGTAIWMRLRRPPAGGSGENME